MSGRFQTEVQAAIAHDLLAIKTWGESTLTNFPVYIICNRDFFLCNNIPTN
jgi:hypothetical protein